MIKNLFLLIFLAFSLFYLGAQEQPTEGQDSENSSEQDPIDPFDVDESTLLFSSPEEDSSEEPLPDLSAQGPVITFWDVVQMILVLGFVIALIYGAIFLLKKLSKNAQAKSKNFTLLSSFSFTPNKSLQLVDVAGEIYLISVTDHNINLMGKIEKKESVDQIRLNYEEEGPGNTGMGFGDLLNQVLGNKSPGGSNPTNEEDNFLKKQKERLKKLQ